MEKVQDFIHAHRVPLLVGLILALFSVLFLFLLCAASQDSDGVKKIVGPHPVDPLDFLLPPQTDILPETLPVLEQNPQNFASDAWTPVDEGLRTRINDEAQELVNQLLERAP